MFISLNRFDALRVSVRSGCGLVLILTACIRLSGMETKICRSFFFDSPGSQVSGCIAWRGVRGSLMETCPGRSLRQPEFASTGKKGRVETSGGEKTSPNLLTRNLVPAMQIYNFLTTSAG